MNRQFSRLLTSLVLLLTFGFVGCDLGTYNKRFKERNQPVAKKAASDEDESGESDQSGQSE